MEVGRSDISTLSVLVQNTNAECHAQKPQIHSVEERVERGAKEAMLLSVHGNEGVKNVQSLGTEVISQKLTLESFRLGLEKIEKVVHQIFDDVRGEVQVMWRELSEEMGCEIQTMNVSWDKILMDTIQKESLRDQLHIFQQIEFGEKQVAQMGTSMDTAIRSLGATIEQIEGGMGNLPILRESMGVLTKKVQSLHVRTSGLEGALGGLQPLVGALVNKVQEQQSRQEAKAPTEGKALKEAKPGSQHLLSLPNVVCDNSTYPNLVEKDPDHPNKLRAHKAKLGGANGSAKRS